MTEENTADDEAQQPRQLTPFGIDPGEIAQVARITDVLTRSGVDVHNIGSITPTDYGLMVDARFYIQTRAVPEDAQAGPETARAPDAGAVETDDEPVVEEIGDDDE